MRRRFVVRSRPGRFDRGSSLVEVLVSVVLLGTAGVAVLAALSSVILASGTHRDVSQNQAALASASDALTTTDATWFPCTGTTPQALTAAYESALSTLVTGGVAVDVTGIEFWNGNAFTGSCGESAGQRLQRLDVTVSLASASATLQVVKRPPTALVPTNGTVPLPTTTTTTTTSTTTTSTTTTSTTTTSTTTTTSAPTTTTPATTTTTTTTTPPTTTTVAPTTTTQPGTVTCTFRVYEAWGVGGNAWLTINNGTNTAINGWRVRITRNGSLLDLWNATDSWTLTSLTARNLSWNGRVEARSSAVPTGGSVTGILIGVNQTYPCTVTSTS